MPKQPYKSDYKSELTEEEHRKMQAARSAPTDEYLMRYVPLDCDDVPGYLEALRMASCFDYDSDDEPGLFIVHRTPPVSEIPDESKL